MKAIESIALFIFLIFFGACLDEDLSVIPEDLAPQTKEYPNVEEALWVHFTAFEDAAAERGFNVDLSKTNIVGVIEEISENNIAGSCSYGGSQRHRDVTIDRTFWNRASHSLREYIVFHELGHCYLFRDHFEACLSNRTYASIMRSGNGDCRDNYNAATREYYLDELLETLQGP